MYILHSLMRSVLIERFRKNSILLIMHKWCSLCVPRTSNTRPLGEPQLIWSWKSLSNHFSCPHDVGGRRELGGERGMEETWSLSRVKIDRMGSRIINPPIWFGSKWLPFLPPPPPPSPPLSCHIEERKAILYEAKLSLQDLTQCLWAWYGVVTCEVVDVFLPCIYTHWALSSVMNMHAHVMHVHMTCSV